MLGSFGEFGDVAAVNGFAGLSGFGNLSGMLGILPAQNMKRIDVEVDTDETGLMYQPTVALSGSDFEFVKRTGSPYHGMRGMDDSGYVVEYDGLNGFFKKLFRKAKKLAQKIAKKVKSVTRKVLKRIPGGKMLMKVGGKIWNISKKIIRPLMKKLGPLALKLAPLAALVPGIGTAVAGGLLAVGTINKIMQSTGVKLFSEGANQISKLKFRDPAQASIFEERLIAATQRANARRR
jgi:hypothetical protein